MGIVLPLILILLACVVIWRACDGFEVASEYLGRNLSEGVRGGTINAVSSSIPELLTTFIALFVLADEDGFAVGLGTTAGSALFNGMIIPAVCIFTVVGTVVAGRRVASVNISSKVILRDGLTLLGCELVMIVLISGERLDWWQGLALMLMYIGYFGYMVLSMQADSVDDAGERSGADESSGSSRGLLRGVLYWMSGGPLLDLERWLVGEHHRQKMREETWNAWPLLSASTAMIAIACWGLVHACEWLGSGPGNKLHPSYELFGYELHGFGMPAIFVAVIFASMATSVPDTVMSIRDARDGDFDDAVANALGSNIFDICFALGLPILLYTLLRGPIEIPPVIAQQTGEILVLLLVITLFGFLIYYIGPRGVAADGTTYVEMRQGTATLLILLYVIFVTFIVARSQDAVWAETVTEILNGALQVLPRVNG